MQEKLKVAIIGGGAAGFFSAIIVKSNYPEASVTLFEKSKKLLAKVAISGGGRCNITNGSSSIKELSSAYPRGRKFMKKLLTQFTTSDIRNWFEQHGVISKVESDNRVFPISDNSKSVVDCLIREARRSGVDIRMRQAVLAISRCDDQVELSLKDTSEMADKVIIATGGSPTERGFKWLESLGHEIVKPVPSLFTFNMPKNPITSLMGVSVPNAIARIQRTKLESHGPLLITHWGMSGPAILKLSAFGARELHKMNYNFIVQVNWTGIKKYDSVLHELKNLKSGQSMKNVINARPYKLPERLWNFLLEKVQITVTKKWGDIGTKELQKLVTVLTNDQYPVSGKTTFKEEFVTSGGVSLESVYHHSLESKVFPNLFFAGEVLDVDGITGGYNFQAAWTTAFIAARLGN